MEKKKESKELKPLTTDHCLTSLSRLGAQRLFTRVWHLSIPSTCTVQLRWLFVSNCTAAITYPHQGEPRSPSDLSRFSAPSFRLHSKEISPELPVQAAMSVPIPVAGTAFCSCGLTGSFPITIPQERRAIPKSFIWGQQLANVIMNSRVRFVCFWVHFVTLIK